MWFTSLVPSDNLSPQAGQVFLAITSVPLHARSEPQSLAWLPSILIGGGRAGRSFGYRPGGGPRSWAGRAGPGRAVGPAGLTVNDFAGTVSSPAPVQPASADPARRQPMVPVRVSNPYGSRLNWV